MANKGQEIEDSHWFIYSLTEPGRLAGSSAQGSSDPSGMSSRLNGTTLLPSIDILDRKDLLQSLLPTKRARTVKADHQARAVPHIPSSITTARKRGTF